MAKARVHIGISGWRYTPWRGDFYPEGLRQKDELRFASRAVNSIEINGTFYALQRPQRFAEWASETPEGFVFSVKGPRFITHVKRLRDIEEAMANFYASGPLSLGDRLGPTLWQFPPNFTFDAGLFEDFLAGLPRTGQQAIALAKGCAERLQHPGYLDGNPKQALRHAVEIRNDSFIDPAFVALLRKHHVALVIADAARSQEVKFIAQELKRQGHDAYRLHRTVTRPWGTYTVLEEGKRFKIKRIVVRPNASLSLQMHHHRSEHWIVVSGMARVTNGEREFLLDTNESTFIKPGHTHRLVNPGVIDLVMIEVQSGEYLGEDDIVRFTDIYGRVPEPPKA